MNYLEVFTGSGASVVAQSLRVFEAIWVNFWPILLVVFCWKVLEHYVRRVAGHYEKKRELAEIKDRWNRLQDMKKRGIPALPARRERRRSSRRRGRW